MVSGRKLKQIVSLRYKKYRDKHRLFVVEGMKSVQELLQSSFSVDEVILTTEVAKKFTMKSDRFVVVERNVMKKISSLATPPEILAIVKMPEESAVETFPDHADLCLLLDGIRDPGNLGSIIRLADWFGVEHVFCSLNTVDKYNPKVIQATMGSLFRVAVHYCDLSYFLKNNRNKMELYAATLDGDSLYSTDFSKPVCVLLGNEAKGLSTSLKQIADHSITIPGNGQAESLNVALAASAIVGEIRRQQLNPQK